MHRFSLQQVHPSPFPTTDIPYWEWNFILFSKLKEIIIFSCFQCYPKEVVFLGEEKERMKTRKGDSGEKFQGGEKNRRAISVKNSSVKTRVMIIFKSWNVNHFIPCNLMNFPLDIPIGRMKRLQKNQNNKVVLKHDWWNLKEKNI
uniref:Uncharacterized protein n=1 Tax=Cucumis melo TaxID=3656 RepID=A0A9I9E6K9_CUCME